MAPTEFQERVYTLLLQIPRGRIASYATLARALNSSPRAVGGACKSNPYDPDVPCHRVIAASGFIGGFKGDWENKADGIGGSKQSMKLQLLSQEGVTFTREGKLMDTSAWYEGPFDVTEKFAVPPRKQLK